MGHGVTVGHNAVAMLMRRAGLAGLPGNRRRKPRIVGAPSAADLVDRDFARKEPDQLWVTDITGHRTREGKVYCAVVLDVFSRRVVGWSIDSSATAALVTSALGMAVDQRQPAEGSTVIHSDQGTQAIHFSVDAQRWGDGAACGTCHKSVVRTRRAALRRACTSRWPGELGVGSCVGILGLLLVETWGSRGQRSEERASYCRLVGGVLAVMPAIRVRGEWQAH